MSSVSSKSDGASVSARKRVHSPDDTADAAKRAKYACSDCGRDGSTENPCPTKHPGLYLKFSTTCKRQPCENYQKTSLNHKTRADRDFRNVLWASCDGVGFKAADMCCMIRPRGVPLGPFAMLIA